MSYKLMYVKNISRLDTWKFENLSEQTSYFNNLTGLTIDDYFPPFFSQSLRLSLDDLINVQNSTHYNYLQLTFNNKEYYYFVREIKYINENLISIDLDMDTIQTFYFDINFKHSTLDRRSIKRKLSKNSHYINRNYIRENLSKGEFVKTQYEEYNRYNYIMVTTRQSMSHSIDYARRSLITDGYDLTNGLYRYLLLLPKMPNDFINTYKLRYPNSNNGYDEIDFTLASLRQCINKLQQDENIVDMIFINNSKFLDKSLHRLDTHLNQIYYITINPDTTKIGVSLGDSSLDVDGTNYSFVPCVTINDYDNVLTSKDIIVNNITLTNNYTNGSLEEPFNIKYIPALLDENYIYVKYGEKMQHTTYPLYKLQQDILKFGERYDFASFSRLYIINDNEYGDNDVYSTRIVVNSLENMDRYTDAWIQYQSTNYATLKSGFKNNLALEISGGLLGGVSSGRMSQGNASVGTSSSVPMFWGSTYGGGTKTTIEDPRLTVAKTGISALKTINNFVTMKDNLQHTPDKRNQGNQYSSDTIGKFTTVFYEVECVKDIEAVAKKLEWFGYKVNECFTDTNLLIDSELYQRYYYNIIKCSDLSIVLNFFIQDENIISDIESRFIDGLRIWEKSNNDYLCDNLKYDNVEKDFVEQPQEEEE